MGENQSLLKQHRYFGSLGVFMKKRIILSAIIAACTTMCLTMSVYADGEGMNGFGNPPEETANKL